MFEKVYGFWAGLTDAVVADIEAAKVIAERNVSLVKEPHAKKATAVFQANAKDVQARVEARMALASDMSKQLFSGFPAFKA